MDLRDLQAALNARGWSPPLAVDGAGGAATDAAIDALLAREIGARALTWPRERRALAAMQVVCRAAGIDVGEVDGFLGPQSRHAFEVWDARLRGDAAPETWRDRAEQAAAQQDARASASGAPIVRNVWPTQAEVTRYYGAVGKNQTMLTCPWPLRIAWDTATIVHRFSVHEKVHDSAARVLDRALDHYKIEGLRALGLDLWGGSLNVRKMRGGSAYSMHSWGIAIDWDPDRNQLQWGRDRARLARADAEKWWELWEEEGWVSLGRARNYDWMHVQAARL